MSERERNGERKIEGKMGELVREMEGKEENGRVSEREGRVKQRENESGAVRKREEEKR